MPHTFTQTSEQKLLFVFTGVAKKSTDLRFPHTRLLTLHINFYSPIRPLTRLSLSGPIEVWASGKRLQKESELLFMSLTLKKRVLYSPTPNKTKGGMRMSY